MARSTEAKPIEVVNLVDRVFVLIRDMIVRLEIEPDTKIAIDSLARRLGVSPTPVREALSRLEADGLVRRTPNVGFRTAVSLGAKSIDQLLELRELVEPFTARRAAETMTDQELATLKAMRAAGRPIGDRGKPSDHLRFAEMDARFHGLIVGASGNAVLIEILGKAHLHFQHFLQSLSHESLPAALDEHDVVIDALLARDGPAAEAAMRRHIGETRERIRRRFSET